MNNKIRKIGIAAASAIFGLNAQGASAHDHDAIKDKNGGIIGYRVPDGVLDPAPQNSQRNDLKPVRYSEARKLLSSFNKDKYFAHRDETGFSVRLEGSDGTVADLTCETQGEEKGSGLGDIACEFLKAGKMRYRGRIDNNHYYEVSLRYKGNADALNSIGNFAFIQPNSEKLTKTRGVIITFTYEF